MWRPTLATLHKNLRAPSRILKNKNKIDNVIHSFHCHVQYSTIPCRYPELLPFISFRCDIPFVFHKLNTIYITISQNTTKIILLCFTTCFGPFIYVIFMLCTLGLESNVSYIQMYYIDDDWDLMFYNMFYNYMFRPFSLGHLQVVYTRPWE